MGAILCWVIPKGQWSGVNKIMLGYPEESVEDNSRFSALRDIICYQCMPVHGINVLPRNDKCG
ncbi:hypothetical protein SY83_14070 [Paenibacillus swuensis]|uniref:Uncharacterized protein n=1 Tax=Paenibacillus swuensis TaxID=1178515 RepID=A0A172TJW8_9BACL|nr:hypothetical protein SY83_14070 [Paenibacillus swuensis]